MRMIKFRVENYRSIIDSGWVAVDDIAVVVGKNESGKSSLLKALWKFNPYHKSKYSLEREWPRGKRKERSLEKIVATVLFKFSEDELDQLRKIHPSCKDITEVEVKRNYKGTHSYNFLSQAPDRSHPIEWVASTIRDRLGEAPEGVSEQFKNQYKKTIEDFITKVEEKGGSQYAIENSATLKTKVNACVHSH